MIIRLEYKTDIPAIRTLYQKAFPDGPEADLLDQLRKNNAFVLSVVAEMDRKLIGHILFTEATAGSRSVAALAPMAVSPTYQHRGTGSLLVKEGLKMVRGLGYPAVIVLGHPGFYPRFGFKPASEWNLHCEYDSVPDEAFMAVVWDETVFDEKTTVRFRPEFSAAAVQPTAD